MGWLTLGLGAAQQGANLLIGDRNRRKSLDAQKEMGRFNYDLEMKKFNETGYGAQLEQMKKAGLSESLMYGGSGGGGVSGSSATSGGGSQGSGDVKPMDIGNIALLAAQTKLVNAQKEKVEVETPKIGTEGDQAKLQYGIDQETRDEAVKQKKEDVRATEEGTNVLKNRDRREQEELGLKINEDVRREIMQGYNIKQSVQNVVNMEQKRTNDVQELERLKAATRLLEESATIEKIKRELWDNNINPNDPTYIRIGAEILEGVGLGIGKKWEFKNPLEDPKGWMELSEKNLNKIWDGLKKMFGSNK